MNSIASICKVKNVAKDATVALNGGEVLAPLAGPFTWNGTTYSKMYAFTALSGTTSLKLPSNKTCGVLMVAGGGGGGCTNWNTGEGAGGGDGGGVIYGTLQLTGNQTYTIAVGAKGNKSVASTNANAGPGNAVPGTSGGNTVISGSGVSETAFGGGRGGYSNGSPDVPTNSGTSGGCGGGSMKPGNNASTVGSTTMSAGACSASTNTRSLTYAGYVGGAGVQSGIGGGGGGAGAAGGAGSTVNNSASGLGGAGYQFAPTGASNDFTGKYYATGGCGGSRSTTNVANQSSIVALGGVPGGTQATPVPADPTTYGTGGSGGWGAYGLSGNLSNNSGANGGQGICIVLVP